MILDDITKGTGVTVLDPHGDLVERLLRLLPENAIDRTIYFDAGDPGWVPLWNPLRPIPGQDLGRTADDLVGAFKSVVTGWGDRLEHLLRHCFYAMMYLPGSSLLDVSNLFLHKSDEGSRVRDAILKVIENAAARQFWQNDFRKYGKDDFGPPKNKLSKLLVCDTVSLMLSQPDSAINLRQIMDEGRIFLGNHSTIGSEAREILGCLIFSLLHRTALSRSDTPEEKRRHHVYCDEAHRFLTDALEDLIAETRKQFRKRRPYLPVNVLHPSWEPAVDARFSGHADNGGAMAAAKEYLHPQVDECDPYPGRMDVREPAYLPYRAELPTSFADDPLPPPREFEADPSPVQASHMYLTDSMFEEALRELPLEASLPDRLEGVVPFEPPTPPPPHDEQLEQLLGTMGLFGGPG